MKKLQDFLFLRGTRSRVREWHRQRTFRHAMKELKSQPDLVFDEDSSLLDRLIYGWGNTAYSAEHDFLIGSLRCIERASGPVLECGSGLSTLLIGVLAARRNIQVWTLENHPAWADLVRQALHTYNIESVQLDVAELKNYGVYDWYDPAFDAMPDKFNVLLCDGPPSNTRGGRYGCLPVMRSRLGSHCSIIIDDADREDERHMAERWAAELSTDFAIIGDRKPYIEITVPAVSVGA